MKQNKMSKINWIAIIIATIAGSLVGLLWYGFLFNSAWAGAHNLVMEGDKIIKNGIEIPANNFSMVFNALSMVIYALFLTYLTNKTGDKTWMSGARLGFIIGIVNWIAIYVNNSFSFTDNILSLIDGSYALVLWTVLAAIVGGMRKE